MFQTCDAMAQGVSIIFSNPCIYNNYDHRLMVNCHGKSSPNITS